MKVLGQRWKKIESDKVFMVAEYCIDVYVSVASIINLLNIADIIYFDSWFMKPTFFGSGLLSLLLLQYGMICLNKENKTLFNLRPYIMGLTVADIVSVCSLPLCLMLFLLVGYFIITGFLTKYGIKHAALTVLLACLGMEIYSLFILQGKDIDNSVGNFLKSIGPDILIVIAAFLCGIVFHKPKAMDKIHLSLSMTTWICTNFRRITRCVGTGICIISLGLFLQYLVTIGIGIQKIFENTEGVFLLRQFEDDTLVLTVLEDQETETYNVSYEKYMGTNNQKVYLHNVGENTYQIVFLEPGYTLAENVQISYTAPEFDALSQWLHKNVYDVQGEHLIIEKTTGDEFITRTVNKHLDEFKPTILMETVIALIGGWISILFIIIVLIAFVIIYARRIVGDKRAALYMILFAYMLAYGAVSSMVMLLFTLVLQCYGAFYLKRSTNT